MPWNQSGNSLIKSSVDLMGLAASGAVAGLFVATVVETGGGWVQGCLTVIAQFICTTASFSLEGRPRMAGPGVSAMYQYDFTLWGWAPGQSGCQVMGPRRSPYRGIWDPLYVVSLVLTWSRPVGRPAGLIWSGYRHRNTQRGNMLPPAPVSTLMPEWSCSLSAGTYRQLDGGVCLIALWCMDISDHDFFRMSVFRLFCWVWCGVGLFRLEGCGPLWHPWCLSCSSTLGSGCGS